MGSDGPRRRLWIGNAGVRSTTPGTEDALNLYSVADRRVHRLGVLRTESWGGSLPRRADGPPPLLLISLPTVTETVLATDAFDMPVKRLTRELQGRLIAQAIGRVAAHEIAALARLQAAF